MRLGTIKKLQVELLPSEVRVWFSQVAQPLNAFLDQVVRALTNQLTIKDNLKSQAYAQSIEAAQVYPLKLAYGLNERPTILLHNLSTQDGSALSSHALSWQLIDGQLQVTISGLSAVKHNLTLIALV